MRVAIIVLSLILLAAGFEDRAEAQQLNIGERVVQFRHENSQCVSSANQSLRLWLATMRLERDSGWFKEDKSANVIVGIRPVYRSTTPGTDAFPYKSTVNLRRGSGDLFVEGGLESGTIAEGFVLNSTAGHVGTVELSVTLTKARGTKDSIKIMASVINQLQSIQLPPNPYSEGFMQFSKLVSGFLSSLENGPKDTQPIWSGRTALAFSRSGTGGDCQGELGTMKTGAFMVVAEPETIDPEKLGDGYVPVNQLSSYCYRISNARTFIPKFAEIGADGACPKYQDMRFLKNPYIGFVMLAEPNSKVNELRKMVDPSLMTVAPHEFASELSTRLEQLAGENSALATTKQSNLKSTIALCKELEIDPATCFGFSR